MKTRKDRVLSKEIKKQTKEEEKIINKKCKKEKRKNESKSNIVDNLQEKITDRIPEKMTVIVEKAFEEGFKLVFDKGIENIEKVSPIKKINDDYTDITNSLELDFTRKKFKKINSLGSKRGNINKVTSAITGSTLGVFGIMLPDIPIFIGMVIKSINEISNAYGIPLDSEEEEIYTLYIICMALSDAKESIDYNKKLDQIENRTLNSYNMGIIKDDVISQTSSILVKNIAGSKFIQNIPIVGAIGGITNYNILHKINKVAKIKYKGRFLDVFIDL